MTQRKRTLWNHLFRRMRKNNPANHAEHQRRFLRPVIEPLEDRRMLTGDLDLTFGGGDGIVTFDFSSNFDSANQVAQDASGRYVVAGRGRTLTGNPGDHFVLVRYTPDGVLDTTFGGGDGFVNTSFGTNNFGVEVGSVAVDASGNYIVAGQTQFGITLARYTPAGVLDTNFDGDGITTTNFAGASVDLEIDGSGRLILSAFGFASGNFVFGIARFTTAGALDTTFGGGNGFVLTDVAPGDDLPAHLVVDGNRYVVSGTISSGGVSNRDFAIVRYTETGALDTTFGGGDGIATADFGANDIAFSMAQDGTGYVVSGQRGTSELALARFTSTGTLDTSFSGDGLVTATGAGDGRGVEVDASGNIVVAGNSLSGANSTTVARFTSAGAIDTTFGGGDGIVTTQILGLSGAARLMIDSSDKYLVTGTAGTTNATRDFFLARYLSSSSDATAPSITSILRQNPAAATTNADQVTFRVTFDEDVQNVDAGDFELSGTAAGDGTIGAPVMVGGDDAVYDITITGLTNSNGTINLDIKSGNNIQDLAGNALGNSPTIGSEETYTLDNTPPAVGANAGLTVNEGAVASGISQAALEFTDTNGPVTYTLDTQPNNGTLYLDNDSNNAPTDASEILTVGESYTQANINAGLLKYDHDGSDTTSDSIQFDVTNGLGNSTTDQTFSITITPADTEITLVGNVLTITDVNNGGDSNDALTISYSSGTYTITDTGGLILDASGVNGSASNGTASVAVPDTGVTSILFDVLGGNDTVTVNSVPTLTGSLTINGGGGHDSIEIAGTTFVGSLIVDGQGAADMVEFTGALNLGASASLTVQNVDTINLPQSDSDITGSGNAAISLTADRNIVMGVDSSITTFNGNVTLNANQGSTAASGNFAGIKLTGATITTSGNGNIELNGRGGDTGGQNNGIELIFSDVTSTGSGATAGTITLSGTGGSGTTDNHGIEFSGNSSNTPTISSVDGDIQITGVGNGSGLGNRGLEFQSVLVESTGTGSDAATITIHGTGGNGTRANYGLQLISDDVRVTSQDGGIQISGIGNGSEDANYGVSMSVGAVVESTGTGAGAATITIQGTAGNGTTASDGVRLSGSNTSVTSIDGAIDISGTAGGTRGAGVFINLAAINATDGSDTATAMISISGNGVGFDAGIELASTINSDLGTVTLTSEDDVLLGGSANGHIVSDSGTVTVVADNASGNNGGEITMDDGSDIDAGSGVIDLDSDGDITLGLLTTSTGVTVDSTSGSILDISDTMGNDIDAATAVLNAATGVGTEANPLETTLDNLEADSGSGGVWVDNTGDLVIGGISGQEGVTGSGNISVLARSALTIGEVVSSTGGGDITLAAEGTLDTDDVSINANVTASGGSGNSISIYAGDAINFAAGTNVSTTFSGNILVSASTDFAGGAGLANGSPTGDGDVFMADGSIIAAGGDATLRGKGNIALSDVFGDSTVITADFDGVGGGLSDGVGTITDNRTGEAPNVTGIEVALRAGSGIGDASADDNDIDVDVADLSATTQTGDISIQDPATLDVTTVDGLSGVSITTGGGGDEILIREGAFGATDELNISQDVTNAGPGNITLFANGNTNSDDLDIQADISASGGDILIVSFEDIDFNGSPTVSTSGTGTIELHAGRLFDFTTGLSAPGAAGGASPSGDVLQGAEYAIETEEGDIEITATIDVNLEEINADSDGSGNAGTVIVTADSDLNGTGAIKDLLAAETANVTGAAAVFRAAQGVSASAEDINTAVDTLAASNTTSGDILITNDVGGLLTIGTGVANDIIWEPFLSGTNDTAGEYDPNTLLVGQDPASAPFSGPWTVLSVNPQHRTIPSGLSYLTLPVAGGSVQNNSTEGVTTRNVDAGPLIGKRLTFSTLYRLDGDIGGTEEDGVFFVFPGGGRVELTHRNTSGEGFGLQIAPGGAGPFTGALANVGETNLLYATLDDEAGIDGADLLTLYVNPTDVSSPAQIIATAAHSVALDNQEFWDSGDTITEAQIDLSTRGGSLAIGTFDEIRVGTTEVVGITNSAPGGTVNVTNLSALLVDEDVTSGGSVTLTASDGAGAGDDLTVDAGNKVESTASSVTLRAGDDLTLEDSSTVRAGTTITLLGDFGNADPGLGTSMSLFGTLDAAGTSGSITVEGEADNDLILVRPDPNLTGVAHTADGLDIDGKGGDDTYHIWNGRLNGGAAAVNVIEAGPAMANDDVVIIEGTDDVSPAGETFHVDGQSGGTVENITHGETVNYPLGVERLIVRGNLGNDTFTGSAGADVGVEPSLTTVITIDGGAPGFGDPYGPGGSPAGTGDVMVFDPLNNVFQIIGKTIFTDGDADFIVMGAADYKGVNFRRIENLPLMPKATTAEMRYDFNAPVAVTEPGYTPVKAGRLYGNGTAGSDFGWVTTAPATFDRGAVLTSSFDDLLRDGHFSGASHTFRADIENGWHLVSVKIGDTNFHDQIQVANQDNGQILLTGQGNLAGQFTAPTFVVQVFDGTLDLTISDLGGDPSWVLNALEIRPGEILTFGSPDSGTLVADGFTEDTFLGFEATPGELITISASMDVTGDDIPDASLQVVSTDMDPDLAGVQVMASPSGTFSYRIRRPSARGTGFVKMEHFTGIQTGCLAIDYEAPSLRRFDFNNPNSPTQAPAATAGLPTGYAGVLPTQLYRHASGTRLLNDPGISPARGYGWTNNVGSFDRGASVPVTGTQAELRRDAHFLGGTQTFTAELAPGDYQVNITLGDTAFHDNIDIRANGVLVPGAVTTNAGQWVQKTFTTSIGASGLLDLEFRDTGGDPTWIVNGIEMRELSLVGTHVLTPNGAGTTISGSGATPLAMITVATTLGSIASPDADPNFAGVQVVAGAGGAFSFDVTPPFLGGTATLTSHEVTGAANGSVMFTYAAGTSTRFDLNGTGSPTAAGFVGVASGTANEYTAAQGFGWTSASGTFDRFGPTDLLRDGHYGTDNTFFIDIANGSYFVHVTLGDAAAARDMVDVHAEGAQVLDNITAPVGQYVHHSFPVTLSDGQLTLRFDDDGGDSLFAVNAIEILDSQLTHTLSPNGSGTTVSGSGATAGSLVTVSTSLGSIASTTTDMDPDYAGVQVMASGGGTFTFDITEPVGAGTATITSEEVTGRGIGSTTFAYAGLGPAVQICDNEDGCFSAPAFTFRDTWGFQGDVRFAAGDSSGDTATWTFTVDPGFDYRVSAYWVTHANRATNAPYEIFDGTAMPVNSVGTASINQRVSTIDVVYTRVLDSGVWFADLGGPYTISGSTLTVTLDDDANGYVIADGIRIERLPALRAETAILDGASVDTLTLDAAAPLVDEGRAAWALEDVTAASRLAGVEVIVTDLPGKVLGLASEVSNTIWLDSNAAGHGWQLDSAASSQPTGMDLLWVISHELGHLLGLDDMDPTAHAGEFMAARLSASTGRLPLGGESVRLTTLDLSQPGYRPSTRVVDDLFSGGAWWASQARPTLQLQLQRQLLRLQPMNAKRDDLFAGDRDSSTLLADELAADVEAVVADRRLLSELTGGQRLERELDELFADTDELFGTFEEKVLQ